ncbi:hypothetical protein K504DRAFT_453885 [Pleomassaria siparia CBS 279.74]|uniref:RING-type domain-containing protein n=1 Tax=Pleomassaria siparia CBS 279.74 TaxID=1314801 RepID=A0A6G1KDD5_9PLEO|nr:hypothetical protein K504DRAFT_453885 [Pleomassaria siparia CBS 279.74]
MPPPMVLPTRRVFVDALRALPLERVSGTCPICQEPFSGADVPVRLPGCGHIYCRSCISEWFHSGRPNSNTCPLDRTTLFKLPLHVLAPSGSGSGSGSGPGRARRNAHHVTLVQGGSIIAVNGMPTREGYRSIVVDLWFFTSYLFRQAENDDLDGLSVPDALLRRPIDDAIPRGMEIPRAMIEILVAVARQMMVLHSENWPRVHVLRPEDADRFTDLLERLAVGLDGIEGSLY